MTATISPADHWTVTRGPFRPSSIYKPLICATFVCFIYYAFLITNADFKATVVRSTVPMIDSSDLNISHTIQNGFRYTSTTPHVRRSRAIARDFVMSGHGQIFILGAAGVNSTREKAWDMFNVVGQRYKTEKEIHFRCCLKYPDESVTQLPVFSEEVFWSTGRVPVPIFNVMCSNTRYNHTDKNLGVPSGVSVIYEGNSCMSSDVNFTEPYFPLRQPNNSLAITTKISHGSLSPDLLIAWMEAYLWLGANKVSTYVLNNVTADYRKVLEYYAARNVLDLYDYHIPGLDDHPRSLVGTRGFQTFTDASLPMFDAQSRAAGYTYFSVVDWDEFIIPSHNRTLIQLMDDLRSTNRLATVFRFKTRYHITSAEPEASDVFLKRYTQRLDAEPTFDRVKSILIPERAHFKSSHIITTNSGFNIMSCPISEAFLRHFRFCILHPANYKICRPASGLNLVKETDVSEWSDNIAENIRRAKKAIFS